MNANTAAKAEHRVDAVELISTALPGLETLFREAVAAVRQKVLVDGRISSARLEAEQHAAHGLSWLATYVTALRELAAYGERLRSEDRYGAIEDYALRIGAGEYAAHRKDRASTLDAAVCEAAFMTGLLRNADVVTMSCYAPLFAREGFVQLAEGDVIGKIVLTMA